MARRHEDWNVGLAEDLRDPEFAREFLLGAIDEEVPLQVALGKVVRAMGVKEFAAKVAQSSPQPHAGHVESAPEALPSGPIATAGPRRAVPP